jgi:lipid A 3-O-deacylase
MAIGLAHAAGVGISLARRSGDASSAQGTVIAPVIRAPLLVSASCRTQPCPSRYPPLSMSSSAVLACRALAVALLSIVSPAQSNAQALFGVANLQNDLFVGRDGGGYTNGIFLSSVRVASRIDAPLEPAALLAPLAPLLGVGRPSLVSFSVGQVIVTPRDLTRTRPDPEDAPYVGGLAFRAAQIEATDDRADLVALSVGVIGPSSGAEQTQKLIHRVVGADRPMGWETQVSDRLLVAIERRAAWRFAPDARARPGNASTDVVLQTGATLGNLKTVADASLLLRYGVALEQSFATTMPVTGPSADPILLGSGWFLFGGMSAERMFSHVGIGESATLRRSKAAFTAGVAYGWKDAALTFALKSVDPLLESSSRRQSYGSLTYVLRLR